MSPSHRYILEAYANQEHLENMRSQTEDTWRVVYAERGTKIELAETNSLIEDEYSLNLTSAQYLVEGATQSREAMIHHHRRGHPLYHLQFKITALGRTIRIYLDMLNNADYEKCIKGFLHLCQDIITHEGKLKKTTDDLPRHFFNEHIGELATERRFLLNRVRSAHGSRQITADDQEVGDEDLQHLRQEPALQPFLDW